MDDDGESVKLAVGPLPMGVSRRERSTRPTVAITDDDDPQVTVSFGAPAYSVAEGGTVEVTVTLDKDPGADCQHPADLDQARAGRRARTTRACPRMPQLQ